MNQEKIWAFHQLKVEDEDSIFSRSSERYDFLAARIAKDARVLNIGIGRGGLEERLQARGVEVFSLDPTAAAVERLRELLGLGEQVQVGYSQDIPFPDQHFDVVVMSEVLEHLDDVTQQQTLVEVARVLAPQGQFLGTVPAEENLAASLCVCPCCGEQFHRWGHVRSYTNAMLKIMLAEHFSDTEIQRHYFAEVSDLNWKGRLARWLKLAQLRVGSTGTNESFFFSGRVR
jgi:SAM-dependent methyltransferase